MDNDSASTLNTTAISRSIVDHNENKFNVVNYSADVSHYFEAISGVQWIIVGVEFGLLTFIVLGNAFVLALFWQERKYHNISHKYIISMAISDLLQGLCSASIVTYLSTGVKIGTSECLAAITVGSTAAIVSLIVILATSIDRYWAIVHPVSYRTKSTETVAVSIIVSSWLIGILLGILLVPLEESPSNPEMPCYVYTERINNTYAIVVSAGIILPCNVAVAFIYYRIYQVIMDAMGPNLSYERKLSELSGLVMRRNTSQSFNGSTISAANSHAGTGEPNNNFGKEKTLEIRTTLILFITVILYLLCWIPGVVLLALLIYDPTSVTIYTMIASYALAPLNSAVDPFLYALNLRGSQRAAKKLLKRILCVKEEEERDCVFSSKASPFPGYSL